MTVYEIPAGDVHIGDQVLIGGLPFEVTDAFRQYDRPGVTIVAKREGWETHRLFPVDTTVSVWRGNGSTVPT